MKATSKALIGIFLTGIIWIVSACVILFIAYALASNNPIAVDDNAQNLKFIASICAIMFMLAYSWKFRHHSKAIFGISLLFTVGVLSYFGYQYSIIRSEQQKVLMKYQEFRQALLDEDYQTAYELMTPRWREKYSVNDVKAETADFLDLGPEDSIYSVHIYDEDTTEIVPSPRTSWWVRASIGRSWRFEKVDSEWYVSPENINFYMSPLQS
jgi:hypothetical protein